MVRRNHGSTRTDTLFPYTTTCRARAGSPAAGMLSGSIKGMLNNCSSGRTPWNSYLTCEETMDNYLDPAQPETNYGWVVEIDPLRELAQPTKRTAMGRFNRSAERRVGQECVSTGRSRWSPTH